MIKHVVQYSGGVCSFFAAKRVVEKFGPQEVVLLFADTRMEDPDLYRFLGETIANVFGWPSIPPMAALLELASQVGEARVTPEGCSGTFVIIADGRNPWEIFKDERMIGNSRMDPCSKILKRELLDAWVNAHAPTAIRYYGLDWTEDDRFTRLRTRMCEKGYMPDWIQAPMMWEPLVDKPDMLVELQAMGIKLPTLYELGFPHNNCGGFCIKAGQAQFRLLLQTMPERYKYHEEQEEKMRQFLNRDVSVLRDRRGGTTKPLTLKNFRLRIEEGQQHDRHDWGGCGCAID